MTVKDLIARLEKMPPDAVVIYRMCSEWQRLDDYEPVISTNYIERNGTYMQFKDKWWDKKEGEPKLITVCKFPGN